MGRTKELKEPNFIGCNLEKVDLDEFDKIRWREHKDRADLLRIALKEFIQRHGSGNDTYKLDDYQDPDFKAYPAICSPQDKWSKFIRENTNKEERMELDKIAKHIRSEIDAKNWLDSRK